MDVFITSVFILFALVVRDTNAVACELGAVAGDPKAFKVTVNIAGVNKQYQVPCYGTEVFDSTLCKCAEPTGTPTVATTPPVPQTTKAFICPFYADPTNPNYFKLFSLDLRQYYTYRCDPGKVFDTPSCRCVYSIPPTTQAQTTTTTQIPSTLPPGATTSATCSRIAATSASQYYEVKQGVVLLKDCLLGAYFDSTFCECVLSVGRQQPECLPELHLTFYGNFKDISDNKIHVDNAHLSVPTNGVAQFDGKGYLRVSRYQNAPFGDSLTILLRFKENLSSRKLETLVANCYFGVGSSVEIAVDPVAQQVLFVVLPEGYPKVVVRVPYTQVNVLKTVQLFYDGRSLAGSVNSVFQTEVFNPTGPKADLHVTYGELSIGTCKTFRTFSGTMTEFALYRCDRRQWPSG